MTTERIIKCDGCDKVLTKDNGGRVGVEVVDEPDPGFITHGYSRTTWDLCRGCASDIVAAIKSKAPGDRE